MTTRLVEELEHREVPPTADGTPIVTASFNDTMAVDGWTHLRVSTAGVFEDDAQSYASGYVEGALTHAQIWAAVANTGANFTWDDNLSAYLRANLVFMHESILANSTTNASELAYWHAVDGVLRQLEGLYDGYIDHAGDGDALPFYALYNMQLGGDMDDLSAALGLQAAARRGALRAENGLIRVPYDAPQRAYRRPHGRNAELVIHADTGVILAKGGPRGLPVDRLHTYAIGDGAGHCSGAVRLLPNGDVISGQTSWSGFEDMLRVYKRYDLPLRITGLPGSPVVPAVSSAFSSYPSGLYSGDDFYTLSSGLVVWETTIGNSNATLYQLYIKPTTVLDWVRNIVANRLASDGRSWCETFEQYNSGTYNNNFAVVDSSKVSPASGPLPARLEAGALFVLDQLPGYVVYADETRLLQQQGYYGSYNVPFFPLTFVLSGEAELAQKYGPWFTYNATARANILRRDAVNVNSTLEFQRLIRYNDFQHDPLSTQGCSGNPPYSAENAIAARDDLNPANGVYPIGALGHRDHAAIDAKYVTASSMRSGSLTAWAQAGPTYDQQPPFAWSTTSPDIANLTHLGMPDLFQFPWIIVDW